MKKSAFEFAVIAALLVAAGASGVRAGSVKDGLTAAAAGINSSSKDGPEAASAAGSTIFTGPSTAKELAAVKAEQNAIVEADFWNRVRAAGLLPSKPTRTARGKKAPRALFDTDKMPIRLYADKMPVTLDTDKMPVALDTDKMPALLAAGGGR